MRCVEALHEIWGELFAGFLNASIHAELRELRHCEPRIAAGIDVVKGSEVHGDVHREAVIAATAAYSQSERGDLRFALPDDGVDARRGGLGISSDAQRFEP